MIKQTGKYAFLVILGAILGVFPSAFADEGATATSDSSSKGNFLSGISKGASNLASSAKNVFSSDVSNEDAGIKPKVRPHFSTSSGWVSDANLTTKKKEGAWAARVAPGVALELPFGDKWYNEVDYTYGFSTTQGPDASSHANTHNLNVLSRYEVSSDTVVGLSNNAQWSELPTHGGNMFFLETATGEVSHRFSEKLEGKLWDTFQYFRDASDYILGGTSRSQDFLDNGLGTSVRYSVTDKIDVTPSFRWNVRHFLDATQKDYWQIQPVVAASYKIGPKTVIKGNFGWAHRKFDQRGLEDELVYGGAVTHTLGRKLVWGINYQKSLQDTFNTGFVNQTDNPEATNLDVLDPNFRVVKSHRVDSSATYNFNEKNSVNAFAAAQFATTNPHDNIITGLKNNERLMETGIRYAYRITRYLSLDIGYAFGRRFVAENNSPGRDTYAFHKITGGVNVAV